MPPRAWYKRVRSDLEALGWRTHQLDQCIFLLHGDKGELIGTCGVYVDDFIIAGRVNDPKWKRQGSNFGTSTHGESGSLTPSRCVECATCRKRLLGSGGPTGLRQEIVPSRVQPSEELAQIEWEIKVGCFWTQNPSRNQWIIAVACLEHAS